MVMIYGTSTRKLSPASRGGTGPHYFSGSVAENIGFAQNINPKDVTAAAKAAHAHQFITELLEGYGSPLGERGVTISGGNVSVSRTLMRDPAIMILDGHKASTP